MAPNQPFRHLCRQFEGNVIHLCMFPFFGGAGSTVRHFGGHTTPQPRPAFFTDPSPFPTPFLCVLGIQKWPINPGPSPCLACRSRGRASQYCPLPSPGSPLLFCFTTLFIFYFWLEGLTTQVDLHNYMLRKTKAENQIKYASRPQAQWRKRRVSLTLLRDRHVIRG